MPHVDALASAVYFCCMGCALFFAQRAREARTERRISGSLDRCRAEFSEQLHGLRAGIVEAAFPTPCAHASIEKVSRIQVLALHRRGDSMASIASVSGMRSADVEILIKLNEMISSRRPIAAAMAQQNGR